MWYGYGHPKLAIYDLQDTGVPAEDWEKTITHHDIDTPMSYAKASMVLHTKWQTLREDLSPWWLEPLLPIALTPCCFPSSQCPFSDCCRSSKADLHRFHHPPGLDYKPQRLQRRASSGVPQLLKFDLAKLCQLGWKSMEKSESPWFAAKVRDSNQILTLLWQVCVALKPESNQSHTGDCMKVI